MARTSGIVPIRLDAAVTATSRVRALSRAARRAGTRPPVAGSKPAHRTPAPVRSAAITHGRTLASWSSRDTTISSPGRHAPERVRDRSKVSAVMLRPKITPSGSALSRSPTARRHCPTISSAFRSAVVVDPRFASGRNIADRMASATTSGVCEPPGPSKCAAPSCSAGKCARIALTSNTTCTTYARRGTIAQVTSEEDRLRDLVVLRRVRDRIDRDYAQPLDVEALARGANMSAGHLSRQFRLPYGGPPYGYLMTRRIERAMTLLRRGDLSVTDVCFAVGCSSLGTFSTRFTELVGMPPSAYRREAALATAGLAACGSEQVRNPLRNREAPLSRPRLA